MIQASYELITNTGKESFTIREFDREGFSAPLHYHPEYELTLITLGQGKRFAGSDMAIFETNDLVLLGPDLPHCWKLDTSKNTKAGSIVIQFSPDFLGDHFFKTPEATGIAGLLKRSDYGISFTGKIQEQVKKEMLKIQLEKNSFKRLIIFLEILHSLSQSKEYRLLNKKSNSVDNFDSNKERILKVFAYIVDHFKTDISLNKASAIIGMTPTAFCKYFKKATQKTFMETVIDYRISFATQLLVQTDNTISTICYESGFGDISHFYKTFTARTKMSPFHYRKQFHSSTIS